MTSRKWPFLSYHLLWTEKYLYHNYLADERFCRPLISGTIFQGFGEGNCKYIAVCLKPTLAIRRGRWSQVDSLWRPTAGSGLSGIDFSFVFNNVLWELYKASSTALRGQSRSSRFLCQLPFPINLTKTLARCLQRCSIWAPEQGSDSFSETSLSTTFILLPWRIIVKSENSTTCG